MPLDPYALGSGQAGRRWLSVLPRTEGSGTGWPWGAGHAAWPGVTRQQFFQQIWLAEWVLMCERRVCWLAEAVLDPASALRMAMSAMPHHGRPRVSHCAGCVAQRLAKRLWARCPVGEAASMALPCASGSGLSGSSNARLASPWRARLCAAPECLRCERCAVRYRAHKHGTRSGAACVGGRQDVLHEKLCRRANRAAAEQLALHPREYCLARGQGMLSAQSVLV